MVETGIRAWIADIEAKGQLLRVSEEIDTLDELGAFVARADYGHIDKTLLFENPKGFDIPVLANTVGADDRRIPAAFGVPAEMGVPGVAKKMGQVLASGGIDPIMVEKGAAPCKEIIWTGDDVDLTKLPIPRLNPRDGDGGKNFAEGRFVTGVAISKPKDGGRNLSYHRFEITHPKGGTVWVFRMTGDARSMETAWGAKMSDPEDGYDAAKGEAYPVAFVLGLTPDQLLTGANAGLPHEADDFKFIGGMSGKPVELVKCETIDVDVPANAEIVIEGVFEPFEFDQQGAFASFNGFYDEARRRPVFKVTAITMRKNPIYQHVQIGLPLNECNNMGAYGRSIRVFRDLMQVMPNVRDVFVDPAAGCGFTVHVAIKKSRVGEPKMAMMRTYTSLMGFCKHCFVYDDDIDIRDPHERDWALAHRFMSDRDLMVVPNVVGMPIEPLAQGEMGGRSRLGVHDGEAQIPLNIRSFMGVDCTVPLGLDMMDRVVRDKEVESRLDGIWAKTFNGTD